MPLHRTVGCPKSLIRMGTSRAEEDPNQGITEFWEGPVMVDEYSKTSMSLPFAGAEAKVESVESHDGKMLENVSCRSSGLLVSPTVLAWCC